MKKNWITFGVLILIPNVVGGLLFLLLQQEIAWELATFIFALFTLIVWLAKYNRNDKKNMHTYGTTRVDKTTMEYQVFRASQRVLFWAGALNIAISYIVFILFGGQA